MAIAVVDGLEFIQVHHDQTERRGRPAKPIQFPGYHLKEVAPVEQAGQGITDTDFPQFMFQLLLAGDIHDQTVPEGAPLQGAFRGGLSMQPAYFTIEANPIINAPECLGAFRHLDTVYQPLDIVGMYHLKHTVDVVLDIFGVNAKEIRDCSPP
nr:hypothetical protein [Ectothiorhodospira magna]